MIPYKDLPKRHGRSRQFSSEVGKARSKEQIWRSNEARRRATKVLIETYRADYEAQVIIERREIDEERGALPGDEGERV